MLRKQPGFELLLRLFCPEIVLQAATAFHAIFTFPASGCTPQSWLLVAAFDLLR